MVLVPWEANWRGESGAVSVWSQRYRHETSSAYAKRSQLGLAKDLQPVAGAQYRLWAEEDQH
jgi:hypothetical protein